MGDPAYDWLADWRAHAPERAARAKAREAFLAETMAKVTVPMTPSQRRMVEGAVINIFDLDMGACPNDHELKEFRVERLAEDSSTLVFVSVVGLLKDEGSMAAVFARDRRHFFIGSKGGLSAYDSKGRRLAGYTATLPNR